MRSALAMCVVLAGCGDNLTPIGPALAPADSLFVVAHPDDDMIFMQPQLLNALRAGPVTTVYVTTASEDGVDHKLFGAVTTAYGAIVRSTDWECGSLALGVATVEHCRLRDRPVSVINLDLADGGIAGDRRDDLLHLVDGTVASVPVDGPDGGRATTETVIELLADILDATSPAEVHTLDLAGTHGRDHSSHLFVASFTLWAAARTGYSGALSWHRGYNVDVEPITLGGDDFDAAANMLGYYEACASGCGPCGTSCAMRIPAHDVWLGRQYGSTRVLGAGGNLSYGDRCLTGDLALADCAGAAPMQLDATGQLRIGDRCLASTSSGALSLETCTRSPEQYWAMDSEGFVWNGRLPDPSADMTYDHVRCLDGDGGPSAATCGDHLRPQWRFVGQGATR